MACESTVPASGVTADIYLYQSTKLSNYCYTTHGDQYRALENAKTFIEGAFSYTDHIVSVDYDTRAISVNEQCWNSFEQRDPCTGAMGTWSSPKPYYKRYIECNSLPTGGDQTIFLTNCDKVHGGIGGAYAWTQTGQNVADLPLSFSLYGSSQEFGGMSTVLHEIGHRFMIANCKNTDDSDHHYGRLGQYGLYDHYETPMGKWDKINPSENACCQTHQEDGSKNWKMTWADCCLATWDC